MFAKKWHKSPIKYRYRYIKVKNCYFDSGADNIFLMNHAALLMLQKYKNRQKRARTEV